MAAPAFSINAPSLSGNWGPELTKVRDNIVWIMLAAAANGHELPDWDTAFSYNGTTGVLEQVDMTYQTDTSIKMRWIMTYSGSPPTIVNRKWYYDKGLGSGLELLAGGTLTYGYTSGKITGIVSS